MQKCIRSAAVVIACLSFAGQDRAQVKSFEILTPEVKQGGTAVVKIYPKWQGPLVCVSVFGKRYVPNKYGYAFIGVDVKIEPTGTKKKLGEYRVYLVKCSRGVRLDQYYDEIEVSKNNFPKTRTAGPGNIMSNRPRKSSELKAINNAFSAEGFSYNDLTDGKNYGDPLKDRDIIDPFGLIYCDDNTRPHYGVDLRVPIGTPVKSVNRGAVVLAARDFSKEGNMIIINHGLGIYSVYMHLSRIDVEVGDVAELGQVIGLSGNTGAGVREPHLHFNIKIQGTYIDSLVLIDTINAVFSSREKP